MKFFPVEWLLFRVVWTSGKFDVVMILEKSVKIDNLCANAKYILRATGLEKLVIYLGNSHSKGSIDIDIVKCTHPAKKGSSPS